MYAIVCQTADFLEPHCCYLLPSIGQLVIILWQRVILKNLTIRQNGQKLFNKQCYNNHIRFQLHLMDGESISLSCKILVSLGTERLVLVLLGTERLTISGHSHELQHSHSTEISFD